MLKEITQQEMLQIPAEEIFNSSQINTNPLVSVVMLTYNHENFIRKSVESVLTQEAVFPIEILIGEDFSIDNTRQECEKLQQEYPQFIRLIVADKNVGITPNFLRLVCRARGKYIALLEGDDYWIHSKKLSLQVELMENHPEYSWCVGKTEGRNLCAKVKNCYNIKDNIKKYIFHTSSVLFRSSCLLTFPREFLQINTLDSVLSVYLCQQGFCGFINQKLSLYRRHCDSLYGGSDSKKRLDMLHLFIDTANGFTDNKYIHLFFQRELWICSMETNINIDNYRFQDWKNNIDLLIIEFPRLIKKIPFRFVQFVIKVLFQPLTFLYLYTRRKLALKSRLEGLIKIFRGKKIS